METENQGREIRRQGMRYRPLLLLGRGGMAQVHLSLAEAPNGFSRLVAVKSVREGLFASAEMQEMFLAEARLSARLNHPNVMQVSEVLETSRGVMLVMEYLDGLSLRAIYAAASEGFSLAMRLRVLCEVLAGLHYAHELTDFDGGSLGIVHRDVTPQNIFVTYDGSVKLLDFGIAKLTASADRTQTGVIKGKIHYMPVEQLMNRELDRRTDVYAVGCLLWEAIANGRMWQTQDRTEIMRSIIRGEMPALSSRVAVDSELDRIVSRAMAREREDRYSTAEEMRLDLEQYLRSLPPVTGHQIGQLLCDVCGESRAQRQRVISESIANVESAPEIQTLTPPDSTSSGGVNTAITSVAPVPAKARYQVIAVPLLVVLAAVGVWRWTTKAPLPSSSLPASTSTPSHEAVVGNDQRVLTVRVVPSSASIAVDGRPIAGNPAVVDVAPSSEHLIKATADGFAQSERRVVVDNDTSVMVELQPQGQTQPSPSEAQLRTSPRRGAGRRPEARPDGTGETPTTDKPSCDPPYYFTNGIKTYRPECI